MTYDWGPKQISVGDNILNSSVMFNWDIYQPLMFGQFGRNNNSNDNDNDNDINNNNDNDINNSNDINNNNDI